MKLIELLKKNKNYASRCSKGHGTDKEEGHYYASSFYDEYFLEYKNNNINLLEIGVQFGGSLYLWNDYFENGSIYGIDVSDLTDDVINSYCRIKRIIGDAYDANLAKSLPDFDIVIDDGPHQLDSFIKCIDIYLPKVKNGGMLVIEDISDINHIEELKKHSKDFKTIIVDTREKYHRPDNLMFVIKK